MGEMFSSEVKGKASGITVLICWLVSFFITKYFDTITKSFGNSVGFWIFTVCCTLSVVFVATLLPETRGKSLQEIQNELSGIKNANYEHENELNNGS